MKPEKNKPIQKKMSSAQATPMIPKKHIIISCVLIFLAAFGVYANTLSGDFIWDDEYLILNNSQIKSFSHFFKAFTTYVGYGSENINNFYRPVQEISDMIDYFLWGKLAMGFHLTNVTLHALVAVMTFLFLLYFIGDILPAFIAAIFYAVHPVHSEAVAYIAGRADSLYTLFFLLSFLFFIKYASTVNSTPFNVKRYFTFSIFFFVLSLLSKEMALIMPLVVLAYCAILYKDKDSRTFTSIKWKWVPFAIIVAIYGFLRSTVLDFSGIAPKSEFAQIPFFERLFTFFRTIVEYLRLLILPNDLHMERTISVTTNLFDPGALFALLVVAIMISLAFSSYKKGQRTVSFAIAWFFVCLFPVSNIIPINSLIAEHWIYLASVGLFLLFGIAISTIMRRPEIKNPLLRYSLTAVLLTAAVPYGIITINRNKDWKDEISFFTSTLKFHPNNARLYLNLGNTYYEKDDHIKAIEQYQKAISINPKFDSAYGNIGSSYMALGDFAKAEQYLNTAIQIQPNFPIAHYNLGIIYSEKGDKTKAIEELKTSVSQLPQFFQAWNMLGDIYLRSGNTQEARNAFSRSLQIMPSQDKIRSKLNSLQ
ncbi:MAG TPA: tetratricopeptide repeat protein [Candidatus Omnitrophota bacterium]|nr:tetratricopeptide repeat protein [Candidatus Omnitrophota bacterium]